MHSVEEDGQPYNYGSLPHEIGHFFTLFHVWTKKSSSSIPDDLYPGGGAIDYELVNGTECEIRGDLICDTEAGPSNRFIPGGNADDTYCVFTGDDGYVSEDNVGSCTEPPCIVIDGPVDSQSNTDDNDELYGTKSLSESGFYDFDFSPNFLWCFYVRLKDFPRDLQSSC